MDDLLDQIDTPERLGELIDNLSAEDLDRAVGAAGAGKILERALRTMEERFLPDRAGDASGTAQFRVTAPDAERHDWHLTIGGGAARAAKGTATDPTSTFSFGIGDFLRLAAGRLNALDGVTSRRIEVGGDLRFAAQLMGWFDLGSGPSDPLAGSLAGIRTPQQLAVLLEGRSDRDINDFVAVVGAEAILEQAFAEMRRRFLPEKAAGRSAVVQWNIDGPDGTRYEHYITVDGGACTVAKGRAESANVTLGFTLPGFLRLAANELNGVQGVMTGKIKISGNLMLGAAMESWFARH
jgi:putative sterol carrier protein